MGCTQGGWVRRARPPPRSIARQRPPLAAAGCPRTILISKPLPPPPKPPQSVANALIVIHLGTKSADSAPAAKAKITV